MTKIIFFGTPEFIIPVLEVLHANFDLLAIVTQPDKPQGRRQLLTPSPAKQFGLEQKIPVLTPSKLDDQFLSNLKTNFPQVDLAVLAAYGKIVPGNLLSYPRHGFLNIHPSLLPAYRGATPTLGPILRGETTTGITYMLMDELMDHGPIVNQIEVEINPQQTRDQLTTDLFQTASADITSVINNYLNNLNQLSPQSHDLAIFTPILKKTDGFIDFLTIRKALANETIELSKFPPKLQSLIQDIYTPQQGAKFLHQACLAVSPWPGLWTFQPDGKRLKILKTTFENNRFNLLEIQLEGKNPQAYNPDLLS